MRPCSRYFYLCFPQNRARDTERAATQALIESYWSIGKRIAKEKLSTQAAYHNAILTDLSDDLGIGVRTLQRTVTDALSVKRLTTAIQGGHYESAQGQPKGKPLKLPRPTNPSYLYKAEVREQLATARTVIVNTRRHDIHRRYVGHVFYAFNNRRIEHTFLTGRYLNQELVDKGFAKVV